MTKRIWQTIIPLGYIILTYLVIAALDQATVDFVTAEDRYFENVGALSLLLASLAFGAAFYISRKRREGTRWRYVTYGLLAALFFFGAGEEISWGQRLLGLQTPAEISAINAKNEINVHNLGVFHRGDKSSLPFRVFQGFGFTFLLCAPLVAAVSPRARQWLERFIPVVPWMFGVMFVTNFALSKIVGSVAYLGQPGEIQESNYEVLFMVVGLYVLLVMLRRADRPAQATLQPAAPPAQALG